MQQRVIAIMFIAGGTLLLLFLYWRFVTAPLPSTLQDEDIPVTEDDLALGTSTEAISTVATSTTTLPVVDTTPVSTKVSTNKAFTDDFTETYVVTEVGKMERSNSAHWWVSSGGYFYSLNGTGRTITGALPATDERRSAYAQSNPLDTDDGYYPQNIFRLVQTGSWRDFEQQVFFRVVGTHLSSSPNRNASNGLLFFNRYQDAFNLYYTGIRVDGLVTIKKKFKGEYVTLAEAKVLPGAYDRDDSPSLLPANMWIGLKSVVFTDHDGLVHVLLYTDIGESGDWSLALEAVDDGTILGDQIIAAGHAGIRTDFMDVEFKQYRIQSH